MLLHETQTPQDRGLVSSRVTGTACAAAQQEARERANERAGQGETDGHGAHVQAGGQAARQGTEEFKTHK